MEIKDLLGDSYHDGMSVEEIAEALKGVTLPTDQSAEVEKLRSAVSAANSDAAEWKRKYRETQDETTRTAAEKEEEHKKLLERVEALEAEKAVASYKATYIAMGYDEKLAEATAKAMQSGDMAKVLECQRAFQASMEQRIRSDLMRNSGRPGGDGDNEGQREDPAVAQAKRIAQQRAKADQASADILKQYL